MGDWKSALRELKKDLLSAKGVGSQSNEAKASPPFPVVKFKNKRSASLPFSPELTGNKAKVSFTRPIQPLATSQKQTQRSVEQKKVAPISKERISIQQNRTPAPVAPSTPQKPKGVPSTFHPQSRTGLTRQANFKFPDKWVSDGIRTQLPSKKQTGSAIDVFIGLDFGTSYTKAAVGLKDQIFVVDWQGVSACPDIYLLPSEFSILADGTCQIGQAPDVPFDHVRQQLKQPLIDAAVSTASLADAAVFVALVLRYVRAWVFLNHGNKIGTSSIRWMLNIGAPSNGLENERHQRAYLKLGSAAWSMSLAETGISTDHARDLIKTWQPDALPQDLIGLDVLPEFVAQIAGYVQSSQRQRGLHALVDVGGGTLDAVTFIVHERDGEDVFPFLVPEIRALGTQMLYQNRLVDAPDHEKLILPDDLLPVLSASEYAQNTGLPEAHITLRDNVFWTEVKGTIYRVFHKTKRNRYRLSDAWTQGLPVFLTGGGGSVEGYIKAVQSGGHQCAPVINLMSLPKHPKLAEFSGSTSDYQRVSVACGLAQDSFSLGQLIPAGQVEDDIDVRRAVAVRPDRDELYAK